MAAGDGGSVNTRIADQLVSYRLGLLRYERGVAERMLAAFDAALKDVTERYEDLSSRIALGSSRDLRQMNRLYELRGELSDAMTQLQMKLNGQLSAALDEVAASELAANAAIFRNVGMTFAQIPDAAVAEAIMAPIGGVNWPGRIREDLRSAEHELQAVLARGVARGGSMPSIAENIKALGTIKEIYRNRFVAIARTEVQRVSNMSAVASYLRNADVVAGMQWLATLDSRTCVVCAPLHNSVWKLREIEKIDRFPPVHPRCRCFFAPYTYSWRELGFPVADPAYDGQPSDGPDFETWLRRQKPAAQEKVLGGPQQRAMWVGGLPLHRFSRDFKPLPLGELRKSVGWLNQGSPMPAA